MFLRGFHVYRSPDDGGGAGGGAPAPAPAAPAASPAPAAAPAPASGSVLSSGAGSAPAPAPGPSAAPAAAPAPAAAIPEKFVVRDAAGQVDHAATALKLATDGYLPLERRLGSGDAPPQTVEGYKVNVPEAFKETVQADALAQTPGVQALLKDLHSAGASQKTVDAAVGAFLREGAAMRTALPQVAAAECEATLKAAEGWKTDQQYRAQIGLAFNAGDKIFGKDFESLVKDYGNDPRFIRGLASIGKEMQEDMPPSAEALTQIQGNLDALMASAAYLDGRHPAHASTMAQVEALTKQMVGNKAVASGRTHSFKTG
jgi:hypothetical protein